MQNTMELGRSGRPMMMSVLGEAILRTRKRVRPESGKPTLPLEQVSDLRGIMLANASLAISGTLMAPLAALTVAAYSQER